MIGSQANHRLGHGWNAIRSLVDLEWIMSEPRLDCDLAAAGNLGHLCRSWVAFILGDQGVFRSPVGSSEPMS